MIVSDERRIVVERSARYYVAGEPGVHIRRVWMLFHGYGQLARDFLEDCAILAGPDVLMVAPEALSRFYTRGGSGRIGASWMTREDRLAEIDDYLAYLNAVWEEVYRECSAEIAVSVLGFSQGGATAARWGLRGNAPVDRLVLWGASIPDEDLLPYTDRLRETKLILVEGEKDPLINREERDRSLETLRREGIQFELTAHPGVHELDADILRELADW